VSRRGLPPTEELRVAVVVQHVPARAHLLPRLWGAMGTPKMPGAWAALGVTEGDPELRNPWTTYQECLRFASVVERLDGATHLLVVQDDALPVGNFHARVVEAVRERPGDLLCLYVPEKPTFMGRAMQVAHQKGERFAVIPGGMFTPLVAAVWPVWMAAECVAWAETTPTSRSRRCDDAQVARFMRTKKYRPVGVVPSLVEHDEATPSTLGLGRYPRHAAILAQ
jgi:hypothetical protein